MRLRKLFLSLATACITLPLIASVNGKFDAASRLRLNTCHASRSTEHVKAFISVTDDFDASLPGVAILRRMGNIFLVHSDMQSLMTASELEGVIRISIEKNLHPDNELSAKAVGAREVAAGTDGRLPYTGKNVLVGLFDTGFDILNPSFRDADGNNRIECFFHYPENECDAIVYDSRSIEALETENHDECHGTHVLGTIAGNYRGFIEKAITPTLSETVDGSVYSGMATDASIAAAGGILSDANIIDGVGRIIDHAKATGKPCVVNLSISDITGPHDGSDLFAASLSELTKDAIIVMSAGNYASHLRTISKEFRPDDLSVGTFLWPLWWSLDHKGVLAIWSADENPLDLRFQFGNIDKTITMDMPISPETEEYIIVTDDYIEGEGRPKGTVDTHFSIGYTDSYIAILTDRSPSGRHCYYIAYELHRRPGGAYAPGVVVSGKPGQRVDMYLDTDWGELQGFYIPGYRDGGDDMTISSMAAAKGTVSVGAWTGLKEWPTLDNKLLNIAETGYVQGTIAPFSSFGKLIDGRTLPHTAAPGAAVISVFSTPYHQAHPEDTFFGISAQSTDLENPVYYTANYGTSMSSPVVAGSIAQWLEADPSLTAEDVLDIISRTSTVDSSVLECHERWGAGKFNALAGLSEVLARKASISMPSTEKGKLTLLRNGNNLEIFLEGITDFKVCLYTPAGQCLGRTNAVDGKATITTRNLINGIYIVKAGDKTQKIIL